MKTAIVHRNPSGFKNTDLSNRIIALTSLPAVFAAADQQRLTQPALSWYVDGMRKARWSYAELIADVGGVATELSSTFGIKRGDRIIVLSGNCPEAYIAYLAILSLGAIAVPVSNLESAKVLQSIVDQVMPVLTIEGTEVAVGNSGDGAQGRRADVSSLLATGRRQVPAPAADVEPDDCAVILFTSGTTSQPKGVCLSHYNLLVNAEGLRRAHALDQHCNHLCILPLFHANAFGFSMIASVYSGCHVVLASRSAGPVLWKVIQQEAIHILSAVPEVLRVLAMRSPGPQTHGTLRYVVSAAAPLSKALAQTFEANTGVPIYQGYGLSECTNFAATMPCSIAADVRTRLMTEWAVPSIGPALFGNEIAVRAGDGRPADACEEGEILVAGHNVMAGYWNAPLETASALRDGWLHTGDLGFYAEINGVNYYFISGRLKEIIIRYGESLGPPTIEKEVCALAQLGRFAVCGFRNEAAGEEIGVYVQACASEHNLAQVRAILMKCALRYRPRAAIVGLGDIPATVTGKIKRSQLAKQFDGFAAIAFVGTPRVVAAETFSNTALFPTARGGLDYEN